MTKKIYWAKDEKDFLYLLEQAYEKHYDAQMDALKWLNAQSLQVEVWKN